MDFIVVCIWNVLALAISYGIVTDSCLTLCKMCGLNEWSIKRIIECTQLPKEK